MKSILCVFLLAACDGGRKPVPTTPSAPIASSALGLSAVLTGNGAAVLVDVALSSGTTAVELSPGDALVAGAPDAPTLGLGEYAPGKYAVLLPTKSQTVSLGFLRGGTAVATTDILLPTPFVIGAPAMPSRAASIQLAWAPGTSTEMLQLAVGGPCISAASRVPDPTSAGFALQSADFSPYIGACTLKVQLDRTDGRTLSGFSSSSTVRVVQTRTLELVTQP